MSLIALLLIVFFLMLLGVIPRWPYSEKWGYGPVGFFGLALLGLVVLLLNGRI